MTESQDASLRIEIPNNKEECDDLRKETKGIITDLLKTPVNPPTDVSS